MKKFVLRDHILMAMLATISIACKPLISPMLNFITDAIFIPGGSVVAGFSLAFIVFGVALIPNSWAGTKIAFLQGILAFIMGVSSFQGLFVLISYTIPGFIIDLVMMFPLLQKNMVLRCEIAGMLGVLTGASITNSAFFNLPLTSFLLFYAIGMLSGFLGGRFAAILTMRLKNVWTSGAVAKSNIKRRTINV